MLLVRIDRKTKKLIVTHNDNNPRDQRTLKNYQEAKLLQ